MEAAERVTLTLVEPDAPPSRDNLLVSAWLKRDLPRRDFLLGNFLCTTSRCLLIGETGVGKTLLALGMAGAIAAGADFLGWQGRRRARVMYLDGELPAETFKERMQLIAAQYGEDIKLYGYNRDDFGQEDIPPLNSKPGEEWLLREIDHVKPDIIFFDSIMCLLTGNMAEEESWAPVKSLCRQISSRRIAQVWLHHTGHDPTKGFGTKTREWEMDLVILLSRLDEDDTEGRSAAFQMEFRKVRNRNPSNFTQFAPKIVRWRESGFAVEARTSLKKARPKSKIIRIEDELMAAYERLADAVQATAGPNGTPVKKVDVEMLREDLKNSGVLNVNEKGHVTPTGRTKFKRAKSALINSNCIVEIEGVIWRTH